MLPLPDVVYEAMVYLMSVTVGFSLFWILTYFIFKREVEKSGKVPKFFPFVSVIIPAKNEKKNIVKTLKSVFNSDYPAEKMEVIVVDDGSTDGTYEVVVKNFPQVKLFRFEKNRGKVHALNFAVKKAKGEVIITLDADTIVSKETIKRLASYFKDPEVGAVSGVYRVRQSVKFSFRNLWRFLLEKFQEIEYLGFASTRKRQEVMDSVLVVPGAIGAFRKKALEEVGYFDPEMLVEDYDVTIKLHKAGYKVKCDKNAVASTVPPLTWKALIKQRLRWSRGGIQILKKHSDIMLNRLGFVSLVLFFEWVAVFMQLFVFGLVFFSLGYGLLNLHGLPNLYLLLLKFLRFGIDVSDYLLMLAFALFILGFVEVLISMKLMRVKKNKWVYFLMPIYTTVLSYVWLVAFLQELVGWKKRWYRGRE